jgi:hypothetical protein
MAHTTAAPTTKATVLVVDRKPYPRYDPARSRLDGARLVELDCADFERSFRRSPCPHSRAAGALDDPRRIVEFDGI